MRLIGLGVIVATFAAATAIVAAQGPTFSSRREIVRVDALVTRDNQVVRNLTAADFSITDAGVPQQVELLSFETLPVSVQFVFDGSASVSGARLERLRDGGRAVIGGLTARDQAGLLTFGRAVDRREVLTADLTRVRAAIDGMQAESGGSGGGTTLIDACYAAMALSDSDVGRTLLLVFTDGVDTSSWLTQERVLEAARRSNVVAYGVSTAPVSRGSFLREFSERTGGSAFHVESVNDLRTTFLRILDEFRQRYVISYTPTGVPASGWHPLVVRVRGRNIVVRARAGYVR
jgi:VWFA-related protein